MFCLLMLALFTTNISEAQTTKKKPHYPAFSVTPLVGINFPLGTLNNVYAPSWNAGIDFNLRVNRETSFFLGAGYHAFPEKNDPSLGPDGSYIVINAGPRYIFTSPKIKAMMFFETGVGAYIFMLKDFTTTATTTTPSETLPSSSTVNFGVNGGLGAIIPLGKSMDFVVKSKVHYVLGSGGDAAHTFVSGKMGLNFMFH